MKKTENPTALHEWEELSKHFCMEGFAPHQIFQRLRTLGDKSPDKVREFKRFLRETSYGKKSLDANQLEVCQDTIESVWALFHAAGSPE